MGKEFQKISVVIPVKNGEKYIQRAIDSIAIQNYPNVEVLVCDGGSTDRTLEILKENKIIPISTKDNNPSEGVNIGFQVATGDIVFSLNYDDELLPGAFNMMNSLRDDSLWYYAPFDMFEGGRYLGTRNEGEVTFERLKRENFFPGIAIFFRPQFFEKVGYYRDDLNWRASDYDIGLRALSLDVIPKKVDKFIVYYKHDSNNGNTREANLSEIRIRREYL